MPRIESKIINYKLIDKDDILISLDRLTRFKNPSDKFRRVYADILTKYLLVPKLSKKQLDLMNSKEINKLIEPIWNDSVRELFGNCENSSSLFSLIKSIDENIFVINDGETSLLMSAKLQINSIFEKHHFGEKTPQNLLLFKKLYEALCIRKNNTQNVFKNAIAIRKKNKLKFPISTLILAEGITEEILLPKFAKKCGYDFNVNGVCVLGAGGKSKVSKTYLEYKNKLKIPVIILLDYDAKEIYLQIKKNLKKKDKIILINKGEFEDILPKSLIKRAINSSFYDIDPVRIRDLAKEQSMCETLHEIYKKRGIGEFQKAHFAKILADTIRYKNDVSAEIAAIVAEIKSIS